MWGTNVGPSMLIASASAGFTTGIVSGNYAWYAFVFICLLAFVFAPRYLGARITTLPEFMGRRFGHSCLVHHCDNPYLVACPDLIRRRYPYPSGFRYSHVAVSINPARYLRILHHGRRAESGSLYQCIPNASAYFRIGHAYYSRSLQSGWRQRIGRSGSGRLLEPEGQMGANFTGWLKILDVPLYILPGIICLALYPGLKNPDEAYMTMVTNLFPVGMVGLVLAVLTAALISTVGSALNALSTVFTMDIYVKKFRPLASQKEIIRTGHVVTMAGALISVIITIAIDSIKGLNLFNVFQSVLGFIAPPMAAVFLFGIFWKRTTTMAANMALTFGTAFSMGVGILYLWVFPAEKYTAWPHFMMLSFYLFVVISAGMILVS